VSRSGIAPTKEHKAGCESDRRVGREHREPGPGRELVGAWKLRRIQPESAAHPPLGPAPGLADIERLAASTRDAGVTVDVHWRGLRKPLPADIDLSAFRIIQEAVTNVVRHAGTDHCQVSIDQQDGQLLIEVTDSGRGGTADGAGYGIVGMRERAALLGGDFSAGPRPGGGFRVITRLPVPARAR
jgi:signal transduction histidine kinase